MSPTPPRQRSPLFRLATRAGAAALVAGSLSGLAVAPAQAATTVITVPAATHDALRAAIAEANALPAAAPGDDIRIEFAENVSGTIEPADGAPRMSNNAYEGSAFTGNGYFYLINANRPVTIDFGNDVSIVSAGDANFGLFDVRTPATIKNAPNLRGGAGSITFYKGSVGGAALAAKDPSGSRVENVGCIDDSVVLESCIAFAGSGYGNIVIDGLEANQQFFSPIYLTDPPVDGPVSNVTISNSNFTSSGGEGFVFFSFNSQATGWTFQGNTFDGAADAGEEDGDGQADRRLVFNTRGSTTDMTVDDNDFLSTFYVWEDYGNTSHRGLKITGNRFTDTTNHALVMRNALHVDNEISGNTFTDILGQPFATIFLTKQANRADSGNVIRDNTFIQSEGVAPNRWAIFAEMFGADGSQSGWSFVENFIDGYDGGTQAPIVVGPSNVKTPVIGNTFGPRTDGGTEAADTEAGTQWFLWNNGANNRVQTWRPSSARFAGGNVSFVVSPVDPPLGSNRPAVVGQTGVDIHVYYTAVDTAEEYLGVIEGVKQAGRVQIAAPGKTQGFIRVQTVDANGNTSQYSGEAEAVEQTDPDTDGDGLTDPEEIEFGSDPEDTDTDDDLLGDQGEFDAGSDPIDPDSDGDGLSDGREVNELGTNPNEEDTDGDGVNDDKELELGTDPTKADTDGDGLTDGEELGFVGPDGPVEGTGTNPVADDSDGDGLLDGYEVKTSETDPLDEDSDDDGLDDGREVDTDGPEGDADTGLGTDPNDADTDGDGLTDAYEVNTSETDPLKADTDGDGLTDDEELDTDGPEGPDTGTGTDPLDADTDGDGLTDGEEVDTDGPEGDEDTGTGTNPKNPDTDGDGLTDGYEVNTSKTDPLDTDTDNDGLTDGEEVDSDGNGPDTGTGTNPNRADTDNDGVNDGDEVDNGTDPLVNNNGGGGGGGGPVTPVDTDGDGISDADETAGGTDPTKADTDGDGLSDPDEIEAGTDPTKADTDGDGLSDSEEADLGTDPAVTDTDGDGLSDSEETELGTDPTDEDTDADGLTDSEEQELGTDATEADSDGDGIDDARELALGSNPRVADTDGDGISDGDEVAGPGLCATGTDPLNPDSDNDKLTDGEEIAGFDMSRKVTTKRGTAPIGLAITDPCDADTDGDGIRDRREMTGFEIGQVVFAKGKETFRIGKVVTNPADPDTDNDGLDDKSEINGNRTKNFGQSKSDPTHYDTDLGGAGDGREIKAGADPSRVSSKPKAP